MDTKIECIVRSRSETMLSSGSGTAASYLTIVSIKSIERIERIERIEEDGSVESIESEIWSLSVRRFGHCGRLYGGFERDSFSSFMDRDDDASDIGQKERKWRSILRCSRLCILFLCWMVIAIFSLKFEERYRSTYPLAIRGGEMASFDISAFDISTTIIIELEGPLTVRSFKQRQVRMEDVQGNSIPYVAVWIKQWDESNHLWRNMTEEWLVQIMQKDSLEETKLTKLYTVSPVLYNEEGAKSYLNLYTNINETIPLYMIIDSTYMTHKLGVILSSILLLVIYIHIAFELVHLPLAGVVCCTLGISVLAAVQLKPDFTSIILWIDFDTVLFYFAFSMLMAILTDTNLSDYLAAAAYELANGHIWPLLNVILLFSFIMGALYNNISVVLFTTPICLRICEVMGLHPAPMLCCLIIASNIGATLTPFNLADIMFKRHILLNGRTLNIGIYIMHMLPATILSVAQCYLHLRLLFINSDKMRYTESIEVRRLAHLIKIWKKTANKAGDKSLDERDFSETVKSRVRSLRKRLRRLGKMPKPPSNYKETVKLLRHSNRIQNPILLGVCLVALCLSALVPILNAFHVGHLSAGWVAIMAAILALSITGEDTDLEKIVSRIDWMTLLFIVSLFILMEVLKRLGLLESVGAAIEIVISGVGQKYTLTCAILLILWVSALLSAFMDNIPIADMMMRIIVRLCNNTDYPLPCGPLFWALVLGCSLGSNGTLMGSLANIACAGIANYHGYSFRFCDYLKIGFPIMVGSTVLASLYLIVAHVFFQWD